MYVCLQVAKHWILDEPGSCVLQLGEQDTKLTKEEEHLLLVVKVDI